MPFCDIFRFHPNGILVNAPDGYRSIHGNKANVKKGKFYDIFPKNKLSITSFNTSDPVIHSQKRRTLNFAFTDKTVCSAEKFIAAHIDRWVEILCDGKEDWSEEKDMVERSDELIFDIISDLLFGKSLDIKERQGDNPFKDVPKSILSYMKLMYLIGQSPVLNVWLRLKPHGLDMLMKLISPTGVKLLFDFIEDGIRHRKATSNEKSQRKDMLHYLLQARDPDTGIPYHLDEIHAEVFVLMVAGSTTVSHVISSVLFYITRDPRVYNKLISEIRTTYKNREEITDGPQLSSCIYLRSCVDEAIRMAPPVPSELHREVLSPGIYIRNNFFPAGTRIGTSAWSLNHNQHFFRDPWIYRPERWIIGSGVTKDDVSTALSAFQPFSIGKYNCPGRKLATMEILLAIGRTLHQLDVRLPSGKISGEENKHSEREMRDMNLYHFRDVYVSQRTGPVVQFKRAG
ncbi:hypothetical protein G7Y89_g8402 [Cudoniella acicularis]|uniref:Cytochrome P450 n=1 Tax=Cudoniella acicularis TaxID=354080 RepID=A0A8H4W138_9HELO|nr:hypothetical protein G7Y89_g8402 [Cudoniella acicularis]